MSITLDIKDLAALADRLGRCRANHPGNVTEIMRRHGATIERKAITITPVDTGFLRKANTYRVESSPGRQSLTVENRMEYAVYQHNKPHRHSQPNVRDHFISIPFFAQIPFLVEDIIKADMQELTQ